MSVDVAFETPEQVAAKLAHYEELFKYRYTERDEEYRQCLNNASRSVEELVNSWTLMWQNVLNHEVLTWLTYVHQKSFLIQLNRFSDLFDERQSQCLQCYKETSVILQYDPSSPSCVPECCRCQWWTRGLREVCSHEEEGDTMTGKEGEGGKGEGRGGERWGGGGGSRG